MGTVTTMFKLKTAAFLDEASFVLSPAGRTAIATTRPCVSP
jgi:hypothetical protein